MPWQSSGGGGGGPWGGGSGGGGGGGGPWGGGSGGGGGGGGPWGRGGPGGGQRPPDIEEMIRKSQDKLKRAMPGGIGGGRGILLVIVGAVVLWLLTGFYQVQPGQQGVVLRFGEWVNQDNLAQPGLHWHIPYPVETVLRPQVDEVRQVEIGYRGRSATAGRGSGAVREVSEESLMLTGDENIALIDFTVQWRIANAGQFLFNIRDPESTIKLAAESAMREIVGRTDIVPLIATEKDIVAVRTRDTLQAILDEYEAGVTITAVNMQAVDPPEQVADAFEEVQRARQDLSTKRNQADAYRNRVIPEARGEARRIIEEAEGYKQRVVAEAEGEAQRFNEIFEAYREAPDVTRQRLYLETLQHVLQDSDKVIFDMGSGDTQPILPFDRLLDPQTASNN